MAFCFHARETVRESVRRVGLELIDALLADFREGMTPTRVHDVRKRCKMLRALLHLARGGLDAKTRRAGITRWRDLARSLGRARDAAVRLESFQAIVSRPGSCAHLAQRLAADAEAERNATLDRALLKRLVARVNAGRRAWLRMPLHQHGWRLLEPGMRTSYREAREALHLLADEPTDEALHELRKCVKTLWYHLRLLGKARPGKLAPLASALERAGELLGVDHDLAMLRAYAAEHDGASIDILDPLITHRRAKLQRKACVLARSVLKPRPRDFLERLESSWKAWRR